MIDRLKEYYFPGEAQKVSPLIPFSPMPGGALTANTQMMRDNNILEKFPQVIDAMGEVVEKGGYGTSVTPVSQFYWQQAFANVMFGKWKKIADGYGKMVLGYFGKTPTEPDSEIVALASEQLKLDPTKENPLDIADRDEKKSISYWTGVLKDEGIEINDENIFIAAACNDKGIEFLKGEATVNVRKNVQDEAQSTTKPSETSDDRVESYTIVLNGEKFNVQVAKGEDVNIVASNKSEETNVKNEAPISSGDGKQVPAPVNGVVTKILSNPGDNVSSDQTVMILESMKMEIEVKAGSDGKVSSIDVAKGQNVEEGQGVFTLV